MRIALLTRQIELWLAVRAIQGALSLLLVNAPASRLAEPQPGVALVAAAVGLVELHRRHERIFAGNLGITRAQVAAILIAPGAIIEAAIGLLGSW